MRSTTQNENLNVGGLEWSGQAVEVQSRGSGVIFFFLFFGKVELQVLIFTGNM